MNANKVLDITHTRMGRVRAEQPVLTASAKAA